VQPENLQHVNLAFFHVNSAISILLLTAVLLDALAPHKDVELAVDSEFMFPHLGALAEVNPKLAVELVQQLGIVKLNRTNRTMPAGYVPPARADEPAVSGPTVRQDEVRLHRDLAIPGQVFVKAGQTVATDTPASLAMSLIDRFFSDTAFFLFSMYALNSTLRIIV